MYHCKLSSGQGNKYTKQNEVNLIQNLLTFSRPVVWNVAEGFAICSLSFNKLLPKAKYMKRPLALMDIFLYPEGATLNSIFSNWLLTYFYTNKFWSLKRSWNACWPSSTRRTAVTSQMVLKLTFPHQFVTVTSAVALPPSADSLLIYQDAYQLQIATAVNMDKS